MAGTIEPKSAQVYEETNGRVQTRPIAGRTPTGALRTVNISETGNLLAEVAPGTIVLGGNVFVNNALVKVAYDTILPVFNALTDVYTYKTGGVAGTTVATLTVTYTDATKETIQSVVSV